MASHGGSEMKIIPILIFLAIIAILMSLLVIIVPALGTTVFSNQPSALDTEQVPVTKQVWGVGLVAPAPIILIGVFMIGVIILLRIK